MFFPFHDDNPTVRTPVITYALIAVNAIGFVAIQRLPPSKQQELTYKLGFMPARIAQLKDPKPILVPLDREVIDPFWRRRLVIRDQLRLDPVPQQILASLVTCMFLHGGWLHLIGNMWFLWLFGNNVEDRLGPVLFLVIYLLGGLLGSGFHWARDPTSLMPVIGASGAVATVLGAYAVTWPWARVHTLIVLFVFITIVDLPALIVLGFWFAIQLLEGAKQGVAAGVAWWAHIGGFLTGVLLMPVFSAVTKPPRGRRSTRHDWW